MALTFNNSNIKEIIFNGTAVDTVIYNGVTVMSDDGETSFYFDCSSNPQNITPKYNLTVLKAPVQVYVGSTKPSNYIQEITQTGPISIGFGVSAESPRVAVKFKKGRIAINNQANKITTANQFLTKAKLGANFYGDVPKAAFNLCDFTTLDLTDTSIDTLGQIYYTSLTSLTIPASVNISNTEPISNSNYDIVNLTIEGTNRQLPPKIIITGGSTLKNVYIHSTAVQNNPSNSTSTPWITGGSYQAVIHVPKSVETLEHAKELYGPYFNYLTTDQSEHTVIFDL